MDGMKIRGMSSQHAFSEIMYEDYGVRWLLRICRVLQM